MKKYITLASLMILLSPLSCYLNNKDTSRILLLLDQPFPPDVKALHVAVYEGSIDESHVLLSQTFFPGSILAIAVPSGPGKAIVIWAEGFNGLANYIGSAMPVNPGQGQDELVPIMMNAVTSSTFNLSSTQTPGEFAWNSVTGADDYEFGQNNSFYQKEIVYHGPLPRCFANPIYGGAGVRAISNVFNLYTDWYSVP